MLDFDDKTNKQRMKGSGGISNLAVNAVLAYYFYRYAFNNPDEGSCWAQYGNQ